MIRVRRTLHRVSKKLEFGEPKTDKIRREIELPQHVEVVTALKKQLGLQLNGSTFIDLAGHKAAMNKCPSDDLVFPNQLGHPMELGTPYYALEKGCFGESPLA